MLFSPRFSRVDQKDLQLGQEFVSYQAEGKLCHNTIKCYLSAVRQMHVAEGYGDPCMSSMARLEQELKGIKSLQARTRGRSLPRLPITPDLLLKMKGVWQKRGTTWDNTMLWAAVPDLGSTGILYGS